MKPDDSGAGKPVGDAARRNLDLRKHACARRQRPGVTFQCDGDVLCADDLDRWHQPLAAAVGQQDGAYTDGKSLAIFFGNADTSSQGGLIRMGRITSDLSLFDTVGENVEVTISLSESEADMEDFDFSVFKNVEITGINTSELSTDEQSVLYQQARYCQAMTEADTETMREITSPDMIFTHMSGRQQTREEYFADIANGNLQYFTIGIENPVVNINGSYASVSYTSVLNANTYGVRGTYRIDGTHWYEKQNENWIACNTPEQ